VNWDAIGALGEVGGAIAVVASLVYLARQIRQNNEELRMTASGNAVSVAQEGFAPLYYERNMEVFFQGLESPESLPAGDQLRFHMLMTRQFANFQNLVFQYERGALDPKLFQTFAAHYRNFAERPGGRAWWNSNRERFLPEVARHLGEPASLLDRSRTPPQGDATGRPRDPVGGG